jgi:hypothetical protein
METTLQVVAISVLVISIILAIGKYDSEKERAS